MTPRDLAIGLALVVFIGVVFALAVSLVVGVVVMFALAVEALMAA